MAERPKCIVVHIQDNKFQLDCSDRQLWKHLHRLGARKRFFCERWIIQFVDDEELGKLLEQIRDMGIPFFGSERGWPPAGIFELYREKGLIKGPYLEALNYGVEHGGWRITEH